MVNVEIKTNIVNYRVKFIEDVTNNYVEAVAYPNLYIISEACIYGVKYDIDVNSVYNETVITNLSTNRKLGKKQKQPIQDYINKIIKEGNEYLTTIINKGTLPICM